MGAKSGLYGGGAINSTLAGQKGAGLIRCVRARIVMVNNDSSSLVRSSNISDDFRPTNCGVPFRIEASRLLMNSKNCGNALVLQHLKIQLKINILFH